MRKGIDSSFCKEYIKCTSCISTLNFFAKEGVDDHMKGEVPDAYQYRLSGQETDI